MKIPLLKGNHPKPEPLKFDFKIAAPTLPFRVGCDPGCLISHEGEPLRLRYATQIAGSILAGCVARDGKFEGDLSAINDLAIEMADLLLRSHYVQISESEVTA